jgi:hypothetical protein
MTIGVGREANGMYYLLDAHAMSSPDVSSFSNPVFPQFFAHVKLVATDL